MENKLCECGCGQETKIIQKNNTLKKHIKGEHFNFIHGHAVCYKKGKNHPGWRGGITKSCGYVLCHNPEHPRSFRDGYIKRATAIAEKALGKILPLGAVVHHFNERKDDDSNPNLIICHDENYHKLIHVRTRAFYACGNASYRKCPYCKKYDDPINLYYSMHAHQECRKIYDKNRPPRLRRKKPALI